MQIVLADKPANPFENWHKLANQGKIWSITMKKLYFVKSSLKNTIEVLNNEVWFVAGAPHLCICLLLLWFTCTNTHTNACQSCFREWSTLCLHTASRDVTWNVRPFAKPSSFISSMLFKKGVWDAIWASILDESFSQLVDACLWHIATWRYKVEQIKYVIGRNLMLDLTIYQKL